MNTKVNEGKLISGKEALIALANGEEVEFFHRDVWDSIGEMIVIDHFMSDKFKFRLKPRTITLNSIEVPAPFEQKENCQVWIIDDGKTDNCRKYNYEVEGDKRNTFIGMWRTEEEIKQVVSALRSIFKGGV